MISVCDDCEYTTLIADVIVQLDKLDKFNVQVWVSNTELPFCFNESWDYHFLQEGIRISKYGNTFYIFYDLISLIEVRSRK